MERKEKIVLIVVATVLIAFVSVFAVIRINGDISASSFTPPEFEASAQEGAPTDTDKSYNSLEFPIYNKVCRVFMDANPKLEGEALKILFTSPAENTPWMRVELYDSKMNMIGESGLIRPGEYLESVNLTKAVKSGEDIKVKVLTYEPDTYYSQGTIKADVRVR